MAKPSHSTRRLGTFVNVNRSSSHQPISVKAPVSSKDNALPDERSTRETDLCMRHIDNAVRGQVNEPRRTDKECSDGNDCSLDHLFLVHSDISSVLRQIDELVVQAANLKTVSKVETEEIESFRSVLSNMLSSLKPWIPRLQKVISDTPLLAEDNEEQSLMSSSGVCLTEDELLEVESPEHTIFESLISPSPLVSWRGDLNIDKGKQLFMLTPLAVGKSQSSKCQDPFKHPIERMTKDVPPKHQLEVSKETASGVARGELVKTGISKPVGNVKCPTESFAEIVPMSSPVLSRKAQSELLMTPLLKMSPPKSCMMFDPASPSPLQATKEACKPTVPPFEASNLNGSQSSGSGCSSDNPSDLALKYPELLGIRHAQISRKTDLESSPNWSFSPPKTCVMLEPMDDKVAYGDGGASNAVTPGALPDSRKELPQETENVKVVESTPTCNEFQSTVGKNRRAGESTLKRELWTRFEAATTVHGLGYNSKALRGTSKKGFLEMLEEVSGNEETPKPGVY